MAKNGGMKVIEGGKAPDIVTVKCVTRMGVLAGRCYLDTFQNTRDALEEQGYIDLVDAEGSPLRVYGDHVIALVHVSTEPKASPLILPR